MKMKQVAVGMVAAGIAIGAQADDFGTGTNTFSIDFVDIGGAGNAADVLTGYGAVDYTYRIGQKEVTIDQFAKAREGDPRIGNGNEGYWNDGTRTAGLDAPASYVSAYEAMKFVNYLTTGNAIRGAYQFDEAGDTLLAIDRDAAVASYGTVYVLPTEDEWYKAAYYKPVDDGSYSIFAHGKSDVVPTVGTSTGWNYGSGFDSVVWETGSGGMEQNGTYDMMGNVREWNESASDGSTTNMAAIRVFRGGSAYISASNLCSSSRNGGRPAFEYIGVGFRVAVIP
ncbi:MAG: SUMF1/EgtB/PvdO family nonheme iron enzyme [Pontiella sp.]